jgi:threonine dehydrogenase-like Zn-dependent dehydrogenase
MHGFKRLGGIADTDMVVVQGTGPAGLFAVAKAVCEGASRVIAIKPIHPAITGKFLDRIGLHTQNASGGCEGPPGSAQ